jgi:hypothetical protein
VSLYIKLDTHWGVLTRCFIDIILPNTIPCYDLTQTGFMYSYRVLLLVTAVSPHFAWRAIGTGPILELLLLNYPKIPHVSFFMACSHILLRKRDTVSLTSLCSIPYIYWLSYSPIGPVDSLCNTNVTHTISAYWLALTPNNKQHLSSFSSQIKQRFSLLQPCT